MRHTTQAAALGRADRRGSMRRSRPFVVALTLSLLAHATAIRAYALAPAYVLQPFNYTSLPWSIVFSYVVFQDLIDPVSLLGAAAIVGAGLVVMARERMRGVPAKAEPMLPGKE